MLNWAALALEKRFFWNEGTYSTSLSMLGLDWLLGSSISSLIVPTPVASMVLLSPKKMVNGEMALKVANHS